MHLKFNDVNDAFRTMVKVFSQGPGIHLVHGSYHKISSSSSRVGDVLYIEEPVTLTYRNPKHRVLFNAARDANPFFHMFEALWMLSGSHYIQPLQHFSSKIGYFCSDDGITANGAYGRRWRHGLADHQSGDEVDQIDHLIKHIRSQPETRRAVLQMWNVENDLMRIDGSSNPESTYSKDVCCNTSVMFLARKDESRRCLVLDMTVTNRSNDLILGCLGANYVHFSILHEYVATAVGMEVGVYNQISNNLHVYTEANGGFHPDKWLSDSTPLQNEPTPVPLFWYRDEFDQDVNRLVELFSSEKIPLPSTLSSMGDWSKGVIDKVVVPMLCAYLCHKSREYDLCDLWIDQIKQTDWRAASKQWITTRKEAWNAKKASGTIEA